MTVTELRDLRDRVDTAIRSAIARSRIERQQVLAPAAPSAASIIDLERERDAWKARKAVTG